MKASTTPTSGFKPLLCKLSGIFFWLAVWEISARIIDIRFIFPTVTDTLISLISGIVTADFWAAIAMTLLRIVLGFVLGVVLGIIFALLSLIPEVKHLVSPIITVSRTIPVASFIMILWLLLSDPFIPTLIALLMVFPVVWQSAYDSASGAPGELAEMCKMYDFSNKKILMYLTVPSMLKGTLPAIITSSGLAWKAGVAAEIITYTKNSIGKNIAEAKNLIEGADLFAWTAVVILFSIGVEALIKALSRKAVAIWEYQ